MNFLFTFTNHIDSWTISQFEQFCWELDEILVVVTSANDNDEGVEFPKNFIMAYVDTDNEEHLDLIQNKYMRLVNECEFIDSTELSKKEGLVQ